MSCCGLAVAILYILSFNPHNKPRRQIVLCVPSKRAKRVSERLWQPMQGHGPRTEIQTHERNTWALNHDSEYNHEALLNLRWYSGTRCYYENQSYALMEWVPSEVYGSRKGMCVHIYLSWCMYSCMNIDLLLSSLSNLPIFSELETKVARPSFIVFP